MDKKLTQQEYDTLISQVETEFAALLAKAESETSQPLAKAEDEPKAEEAKEESKAEEKAEEKKSDEESKEEAKAEPSAEDKKDEESHDYSDEDKDEMHKMYGSMSKAELGLHKEAMEKCWMSKCGDMTQMAKSEETKPEAVVTEPSKEEQLLKSEVEGLKKENDDLKKNLEGLVATMEKFLTQKQPPARKAISEIGVIAKSEETEEKKELSKSEIHKILSQKAREASLSKSDQEAIKNYYLSNAGSESIRHLLK